MSEPQIFRVGISPAQRLTLLNVLDPEVKFLAGWEDHLRLQRLKEAFKTGVIQTAADKTGGPVNRAQASNPIPAEFILTLENVDFLDAALRQLPMTPRQSGVLASLMTEITNIRRGMTPPPYPPFDEAADEAAWPIPA